MTTDHEASALAQLREADPWPDMVAVGQGSTEVIPRVWAERILGSLRDNRPGIWRSELGKASTGG